MSAKAINKLWIVEKPSVVTGLVEGLEMAFGVKKVNQATAREDGYTLLSNGDAIVPLLGHLLEMEYLSPEHKSAQLGTYFNFLPVKVTHPTYRPRADIGKDGSPRMGKDGKPIPTRAYSVVTKLLRNCREVVNAGDIDREGQRIVDELLEHLDIDPNGSKKPVWRLSLVSNRPEDIAKLVTKLERNGEAKWRLRGEEARVRALLDAATGYNGSMAMQELTGRRNMSVGRVQTPLLSIVYERDMRIENFKPRDYYVPVIILADGTEMRWFRREGAENLPGFDEEGRIVDRAMAQQIVERIARGLKGTVTAAESRKGSEAPPLPFTNASLASTVAKRYGLTPNAAEKCAQKLYESHKAISYVGTDCQFLPTSMHADAHKTLSALAKLMPGKCGGANTKLVSAAWNDDKVDEHYAIVPTGVVPTNLTQDERSVFETVVKRYIAQFYPAHEYLKHSLAAVFGSDEFRASRREVVRNGWKDVEGDAEMGGRDLKTEDEEAEVAVDAQAAQAQARHHEVRR